MAHGRMGTTGVESGLSASYHSYEPKKKTSRLPVFYLTAALDGPRANTFSPTPHICIFGALRARSASATEAAAYHGVCLQARRPKTGFVF